MKCIFFVIVFLHILYETVYSIKVKESIFIDPVDPDESFAEGSRVVLVCKGTSIHTKLDWLSPNGDIIKRNPGERVFVQEHIAKGRVTSLWLIISQAQPADTGVWTCKSGSQVKSVPLCVTVDIQFATTTNEIIINQNRAITLSCQPKFVSASGLPPNSPQEPLVTWKRNGELITELNDKDKYSISYKYNLDSSENLLTIRPVLAEDAGIYTCVAEFSIPQVENCISNGYYNISLLVNTEPSFENITQTIYSAKNKSVDLICVAKGYPTPKYRFFKISNEVLSEFTEDRIKLSDDRRQATLTIVAKDSTYGEYKCRAENSLGEAENDFSLKVLKEPSTPKVTVLNITESSVQLELTWTDIDFPIDDLELQYLVKDKRPRENDWKRAHTDHNLEIEQLNSDSEELIITSSNLNHETTYWMRVRVINELGESAWSTPISATTESKSIEADELDVVDDTISATDSPSEARSEDSKETVSNSNDADANLNLYGLFFIIAVLIVIIIYMCATKVI